MFWQKKEKITSVKENGQVLAILNCLKDGILVFNGENKLIFINPEAEKILGVEKEKVIGKRVLDLTVFPKAGPLVSLLGGEVREVNKSELKLAEDLILQVSSIPVAARGDKNGNVVVLTNITQDKLIERKKSEFVALAAHQLRTPSSAVKWALEMLLEGDMGKLAAKQKEVIQRALDTNDHMIHLIGDLLTVAQIERGGYLGRVLLSDLREMANFAIQELKDKIKDRKIDFKYERQAGNFAKVMMDPDKIKMAIINLLDNALKYTPEGGKIELVVKSSEDEVGVMVKDSGYGIPRHQQGKVFATFFRGDNVVRKDTEGTGLGLFITKNIIDAHKGRIWFESEEGKGSAFYFTLPVKEEFGEYITREFY